VNRRAPLFVAGGFALVAVLAFVLLVLPKMGQVGETQDELATAENEESSLQAQLQALQDAEAAAPETERQIAEIEDLVPPTADLPELFLLLQAAADGSAVDFFSFSPGTPLAAATGDHSVIQSQVTVTGGYFALDDFLFRLETLDRAAKVISISITPGAEGEGGVTAGTSALTMLMTVEFYTTDLSAGPASTPGPTEGAPAAPADGGAATDGTTEPGAS
jgi:Tfp pilus assembly protein PilO